MSGNGIAVNRCDRQNLCRMALWSSANLCKHRTKTTHHTCADMADYCAQLPTQRQQGICVLPASLCGISTYRLKRLCTALWGSLTSTITFISLRSLTPTMNSKCRSTVQWLKHRTRCEEVLGSILTYCAVQYSNALSTG